MQELIYKKIEETVKGARSVLVAAHQKPDSDALGSIFAVTKYLDHLNKRYKVYLEEEINYRDFPFLDQRSIVKENIDWNDIDLVITLDSGDIGRAGLEEIKYNKPAHLSIINIDHHVSNTNFGDINLVDSNASSTTEIITKLFKYLEFNIDKDTASALLLGLLTDTDNFSNDGTSPDSFEISSHLLEKGANISKLNYNKKDKKMDALKIWGKSFERLKMNSDFSSVYTVVTKEEMEKAESGGFADNVEDLVNFFNYLKDLKFVMVLKEHEDKVRVSLRTTNNNIDVSRLALFFNGGGHKKAAGFSINGKLEKTKTGWKIV